MVEIFGNWSIDHVGHAVENLDKTIEYYQRVFGFALDYRESLPEHQVEVAFFRLPNSQLELLAPTTGNKSLTKFLATRGEGLHHLAFRVAAVDDELKRLTGLGVELIDKTARPGARNTKVAFVHPHSLHGILIELVSER